jgi:hypothetical protein
MATVATFWKALTITHVRINRLQIRGFERPELLFIKPFCSRYVNKL